MNNPVPATLARPGALNFWLAVLLIGASTGASTIGLTLFLQAVQHWAWPADTRSILSAAEQAGACHHIWILVAAGVLTGCAQLALVRLTSGNGIDIIEAIWFNSGRLPVLRTLGSA